LFVVFGLFALLAVNSVYLASITAAEHLTGRTYQNWFYLNMFLGHLVLGLAIVVPVIVFGICHLRNARSRPNKRAIRAGYALFTTAILVLVSGFVLTRFDALGVRIDVKDPALRRSVYWIHVLAPLAAAWLFVLHRLAGRRIRWKVGLGWAAVAGVFAVAMLGLHSQDPRAWNVAGNPTGEQYFFPGLSRTVSGDFIPQRVLHNDDYCRECHADVHEGWSRSVHRFSSFNNPAYVFSVQGTRRAMMERDGSVQGSRFCAGCHDPVPFFSGAFDDPRFDDPDYDLARDPMAQAGITCTVCHAITHVGNTTPQGTVLGNGDYTIDEPTHYPFTFSDSPALRWLNRQLVKAKPAFHKATFLKPEIHRSTQFCGTCHKVHLPVELNAYKYLRGQNHYDAFWLSGVSGYGVSSFYYPAQAEANCNQCHMPLRASDDFGARAFASDPQDPLYGRFAVHDHQFPAANTAIPHLLNMPPEAVTAHQEFLEGVMRVDLFGIKEGGTVDGRLLAPLRPDVPALVPGQAYLLETVIRTVKMGHLFTQGTADSNEVWLDVAVTTGDRVVGRSGALDPRDRAVDPWSHFVNAFVIDREGNRIDRRNAQDIFVALYDNQIPPGAADTVHYRFTVPPDATEPVTVEVALRYRKFDATYMKLFQGDAFVTNDLPITTLATDRVTFPLSGGPAPEGNREPDVEPWVRWNDYGIGLLRKGGGRGELRQAEQAFREVEALGRPDGPINLARVHINEGLVQTHAPEALARAAAFDPPPRPWSLLWFTGQVSMRNGDYARAVDAFRQIVEGGFREASGRNFDFAKDYRLLNALGQATYQLALPERGSRRAELMRDAAAWYERALALDTENLNAHWGLKQVYRDLGDEARERRHAELHGYYKPDDNARDYAVARARLKYAAANHAAEAVVIYDLQRPGNYGLPGPLDEVARND
jgi:hypothetical protein